MLRAVLLSISISIFMVGCNPGREVIKFPRRPKMYRSLASLSPGTSEIAGSIASNIKMVGRTAACNYPNYISNGPTAVPVVAQVKPDYEKLKAQNPELVIYDADLYGPQDVAQLKALGIDLFEFNADTLEEFYDELLKFGAVTGIEMETSAYVDKIVQEQKSAQTLAPKPTPKIALILPGKGGEHYIAGTKNFHADVVRAAGGEPVGPEQDKYVPIDAETLIKLNPDMIITAGEPDSLVNDPRLKSMSAVAKLKVRGINQDLTTRKGYRVDKELKLMSTAILTMAEGS
jgi:iron complex transport system substrate-binding protein